MPSSSPTARTRVALALLCAAFFMGVLDSTSIFAALPSIGNDLAMEMSSLAWVVTIYGVVVAGFMLPFGRVADIVGRRRVFVAALIIFAAGSLACGLATSGGVLIGARAVQALGAAALMPSALALVLSMFPEGPDRNRALGIWGGLGGIGATTGLLIGGVLTDLVGWPWIFFTNVPACLLVIAATPFLISESQARTRRRFDLLGGALVSASLMLLVFGLLELPNSGWSPSVWLPLLGAIVMGATFVLVERESRDPIVPKRLLRSRPLVTGNVVVIASGACVDGLLALMTVYTQQILGLSPVTFGAVLAAMTVSSVIAVAWGQRLVTRYGLRPIAVTGLVLLAASCGAFTVLEPEADTFPLLIAGLLVFGAGMGAAFVAGQIAAVTGVAADDAGAASGVEETSFTVGSTLGVALVTAVSFTAASAADGPIEMQGIRAALATLAILSAATAAATFVLLKPRRAEPGAGKRPLGPQTMDVSEENPPRPD